MLLTVIVFPNADEGEWRNGKMHGHGKHIAADGSFYRKSSFKTSQCMVRNPPRGRLLLFLTQLGAAEAVPTLPRRLRTCELQGGVLLNLNALEASRETSPCPDPDGVTHSCSYQSTPPCVL